MNDIQKYFGKIKDTAESVRKTGIPSEWELERIQECIDGLFSFAKFKVGDKVKMAETYPVNEKDSWGWMSYRHLLTKGQTATIKGIDWHKGKFIYLIEFDENTWINDANEIKPSTSCHNFNIGQKWLTRIDSKK